MQKYKIVQKKSPTKYVLTKSKENTNIEFLKPVYTLQANYRLSHPLVISQTIFFF